LKGINLSFIINRQILEFLSFVGGHGSFWSCSDRFQCSLETFSRHFHGVLKALISMSPIWIVHPPSETPACFKDDPKYDPFFEKCIGAFDGTFIPMWIRPEDQSPWRDRKNNISQNVLAVCDFDLKFTHVFAGMEGSAPDSVVLNHVLTSGLFQIPEGSFFLGDGGYALSKYVLTPFRGVRYHLKEWGQGADRYCLLLCNLKGPRVKKNFLIFVMPKRETLLSVSLE
jgi:hypothetical protein